MQFCPGVTTLIKKCARTIRSFFGREILDHFSLVHSHLNKLDSTVSELGARLSIQAARLAAQDDQLLTMQAGMADIASALRNAKGNAEPSTLKKESLTYIRLTGTPPPPLEPPRMASLGSRICRQADLCTDAYRYWMARMKLPPMMNRKYWEWFFLTQALRERDMLRPGRTGLGFGVGNEPLSALFASMGADILATDSPADDAAAGGWVQTGQHAADLQALNMAGICPQDQFGTRVRFRTVNMNAIPAELEGQFDFCWSSCCFEHLGSLEHGLRFVEESMRTLKPGGVGVHTTEYNISSNDRTFESPTLSIYRRCDLEKLIDRLQRAGHNVAVVDWEVGDGLADAYVDLPPYGTDPHLRLKILEHTVTSIGLVLTRV